MFFKQGNCRYFSTNYRRLCDFLPPIRRYCRKISGKISTRDLVYFLFNIWLVYSIYPRQNPPNCNEQNESFLND